MKILNNIISSQECSFLPTQVYFCFGIFKVTVDEIAIGPSLKQPPVILITAKSWPTMGTYHYCDNFIVFNLNLIQCLGSGSVGSARFWLPGSTDPDPRSKISTMDQIRINCFQCGSRIRLIRIKFNWILSTDLINIF